MGGIFISYSSRDRQFAERLATDLYREGMEVWLDEWQMTAGTDVPGVLTQSISMYDYFCIAVTEQSIRSDWVLYELEKALEKEKSESGGLVVPLLLNRIPTPERLSGHEVVDFTHSYDDGLKRLISILGRVTVRRVIDTKTLQVATARRGAPSRLGSVKPCAADGYKIEGGTLNRIGSMCWGTAESDGTGIFAIAESIGDSLVAPHLTSEIGHLILQLLNKGMISVRPEAVTRIFALTDSIAKTLNERHGLTCNRRVSAKLAVMLRIGSTVYLAVMGRVGLLYGAIATHHVRDPLNIVLRTPCRLEYASVRENSQSAPFRAPLGYLVQDGFAVSPHRLELNAGEYVALTSFCLPNESEFEVLKETLAQCQDGAGIVETLTSWHWPAVTDSISLALHYRL